MKQLKINIAEVLKVDENNIEQIQLVDEAVTDKNGRVIGTRSVVLVTIF